MGGRGAVSGFVNRVPNAEKATIAESKITKYCLNPEKAHYHEFTAVGYSQEDPERLKRDLLDSVRSSSKAKMYEVNEHGERSFEVETELGVTRKAPFKTIWQIDKGSDYPRFITAYRVGRKKNEI